MKTILRDLRWILPVSLGLGLALSRGIVEAHGGTIMAQSDTGKGSLFTLSLPLKDEIAASA